jgi:MSHA biogenesis protein MshP
MTSLFLISPSRKACNVLPARQGGSALVVAIFVIVVMALISVGLTAMIQDTSRNAAWDVLGTRAELAAYSGLEQALSELFPLNQAATTLGQCNDVTLEPTLNGQGLSSCSVTLTCQQKDITELSARFFELQATGQCGSGEVLVQRSQSIQARSAL